MFIKNWLVYRRHWVICNLLGRRAIPWLKDGHIIAWVIFIFVRLNINVFLYTSLKTFPQASLKGLTIMEDRPIVTCPSCKFLVIERMILMLKIRSVPFVIRNQFCINMNVSFCFVILLFFYLFIFYFVYKMILKIKKWNEWTGGWMDGWIRNEIISHSPAYQCWFIFSF